MAQSTIQEDGRFIEIILINSVESGFVVHQHQIIGVALTSGQIGDKIAVDTEGVHILPAITTLAFIAGEEIHWDGSKVTNVRSHNVLIGTAYTKKGILENKAQVKLHSFLTSLGGTVEPSEMESSIIGGIITFNSNNVGDIIEPGPSGYVLTSKGPGNEPTYESSVGGTIELNEVKDTDHGGVVIINSSGIGDTISADTLGKVLTANGPDTVPSFKTLPADNIGANAALSNIASVAINASLLPATTETIDLGSIGLRFKDTHTKNIDVSGVVEFGKLPTEPGTPSTDNVKIFAREVSGISTLLLKDDTGDVVDLINDFTTRSQEANNTIKFDTEFGTATVYRVTASFSGSTVTIGRVFYFIASNTNTGEATFIVNSISAIPILKNNDIVLAAGDIEAGQAVTLLFDGTNYQMMSPTSDLGISDLIDDISPQLGGNLDLNGNKLTQNGENILSATNDINGVNYFNIQTGRSGSSPTLHVAGPNTNTNMRFSAKGRGSFIIFGNNLQGDLFVFDSSLVQNYAGVYRFQLPNNFSDVRCVFPLTNTTLIGNNTPDIVTNKTIDADSNTIINIGSSEIKAEIITGQISSTVVAADNFTFSDTSDSGALKRDTFQGIIDLSGDMFLADAQTITGPKTFNESTFLLNGSTSGTSTLNASAIAGNTTFTFPSASGTILTDTNIGSTLQAWNADLTTLASTDGYNIATSSLPANLHFAEATSNGTNTVILTGNDSLDADITVTLPDATGTLALTSDIGSTVGSHRTITTYNVSLQTEIIMTGDITTTYDDYIIEGDLSITANNQELFIEWSNDNGVTYYNLTYGIIQIGSTTVTGESHSDNSKLIIAKDVRIAGPVNFKISLKRIRTNDRHIIKGESAWLASGTGTSVATATFAASDLQIFSINAIRISVGLSTFSGTIHMKGVVK